MATKAERIDQIFARRAELRDDLRLMRTSLAGLSDALAELDQARRALQLKVDPTAAAELHEIGVDVDALNRRLAAVRRDTDRTDARMARPTLTVGAVGRAGQGKSRFLQSLTGLTDREIPSGRGSFMTGAPSVIRHRVGPTTAEVEFHDEASFLAEIIGPYFGKLGLGPEPASVSEFARKPVPELPADVDNRAKEAHDHLRAYHDHLGAYREYVLSPERLRTIGADEILRYVAQHDGAGTPSHLFRAVRRLQITAPFSGDDLDRLAVIDLPGMGDTNLHDENVLRRALEDEVDLVLFLVRPDPLRVAVQTPDVELYDLARSTLPELPIARWSCLVVNRVEDGEGANARVTDEYAAAVGRSRFQVSRVETADAADPGQVGAAFAGIVEHVVGILAELDRSLVDRRRSDLAAVRAETLLLIDKARAIGRRAVPSGAWFPRFLQLFNDVHGTLSRGLDDLVHRFGEEVTERNDELHEAIQSALSQAKALVVPPPAEEINTLASREGALGNVLNNLINESRAQISRQFLALDFALKRGVDAMHQEVATVLAEAGRLPVRPGDPGDARERLREFEERFPDDRGVPELRYGFRFLTDFVLNYRGMIQHRVRRVLGKLSPDELPFEPGTSADYVRYTVEELIAETLFEIETALQGISFEPREAIFAVVEEFRDRVLRSPDAEDEWRTLYEALRVEIWAEEFEALAANTTLFARWTHAVKGLAAAATED